ncbi:hypothetical protein AX15_002327 [Amanita polypyramis BW_CC]|nr:hypothetical protein AX15_002327 [Amanita polypyramis BW_CC]
MLSLPPIQGRYAVSTTTFVTPVRPTRVFGSAMHRVNASPVDQLEPALRMEEVGFTAYYPADTSLASQRGLDWLLRPARVSLKGYSIFSAIPTWILWPAIYLFGIFVKVPVYTNAPLLRPPLGRLAHESEVSTSQWPLVIFSHGLGGSRTAYSNYCSRLAASGKVVLAVEHRDGTGHACVTHSWDDNGRRVPRPIYYLKENQVVWDVQSTDAVPTPFPLRLEQLDYRRQELYTVYNTFCDFLKGEEFSELVTLEGAAIHDSWISMDSETNQSPVKYYEDVTLMGHSFGGCTVLSVLSTSPPLEHKHIPIAQMLVLDPWLEPLPTPGLIPHLRPNSNGDATSSSSSSLEDTVIDNDPLSKAVAQESKLPRILVINSETFTLWEEHFSRLQKLIKAWEPESKKLITLVGSKHQSFSDFPILPLIKTKAALKLHDTIVSASLAFLDSNFDQFLEVAPKRDMEVLVIGMKDNGKPRRKLFGDVGDIIIH